MQPQEPSLDSTLSNADVLQRLEGIHDDRVFYPGHQYGKYLDLLAHLSRYSNLMLTLTGPVGSGKSHLRRKLLASLDTGVVVCPLDAEQTNDKSALLTALNQSLELGVPGKAEAETYLEYLRRHCSLLAEDGRSCLLIFDNAESLEDDALSLLLELANTEEDNQRPHMLLLGLPELFERLSRAPFQSRFEPVGHHLALDPMSEVESRAYLETRLRSVGVTTFPFSDAQMHNLYKRSRGWPGSLNIAALKALGEQDITPIEAETPNKSEQDKARQHAKKQREAEKLAKARQQKKMRRPLPVLPLAGAAVFIALAAIIYIYSDSFSGKSPDLSVLARSNEIAKRESNTPLMPIEISNPADPQENTATPPQASDSSSSTPNRNNSSQDIATEQDQPNRQEIDIPIPSDSSAQTENEKTPEALQPDLPDDTGVAADTETPSEATDNNESETAQSTPEPQTSTPEPQASTNSNATQSEAPQPQNQGLQREAWLMERNAGHYTLQMMGSLEESSVIEFIQAQSNQSEFTYFESRYQGQPWYVVVHGDYPNRNAAVRGIESLPTPLRRMQPWARSFGSVQEDIRNR